MATVTGVAGGLAVVRLETEQERMAAYKLGLHKKVGVSLPSKEASRVCSRIMAQVGRIKKGSPLNEFS